MHPHTKQWISINYPCRILSKSGDCVPLVFVLYFIEYQHCFNTTTTPTPPTPHPPPPTPPHPTPQIVLRVFSSCIILMLLSKILQIQNEALKYNPLGHMYESIQRNMFIKDIEVSNWSHDFAEFDLLYFSILLTSVFSVNISLNLFREMQEHQSWVSVKPNVLLTYCKASGQYKWILLAHLASLMRSLEPYQDHICGRLKVVICALEGFMFAINLICYNNDDNSSRMWHIPSSIRRTLIYD